MIRGFLSSVRWMDSLWVSVVSWCHQWNAYKNYLIFFNKNWKRKIKMFGISDRPSLFIYNGKIPRLYVHCLWTSHVSQWKTYIGGLGESTSTIHHANHAYAWLPIVFSCGLAATYFIHINWDNFPPGEMIRRGVYGYQIDRTGKLRAATMIWS